MKKLTLVTCSLLLLVTSCKDKDDKCIGGNGGNVTFVLFPKHHGKAIPSLSGHIDTAYIKYNTLDAPAGGTSAYDQVVVGEAGENHLHVPQLKCGNYYIFVTGYDTSISQRVKGGIPYSTSEKSGEVDIEVPVSE